jgi:DNA-binding transcriptional MerR regulator
MDAEEKDVPRDAELSESHLTVNEFAKLTGISKSTLIYYDKVGIFMPTMRGENNYRMYAPNQLTTVNQIRVLTELGVPIKKIKSIVSERSPETIIGIMDENLRKIEEQIVWLRNSIKIGNTVQDLVERGLKAVRDGDVDRITINELPTRPFALGPAIDRERSGSFYSEFSRFLKYSRENGFNLSFPIGGRFKDFKSFSDNSSLPDNWFYVNAEGRFKRKGGRYVIGYTRGYYGVAGDIAERMRDFIEANGLEVTGPVYNVYLLDEISIPDPNDYLMQASVRIKD